MIARTIPLADGHAIPVIGLGVMSISDEALPASMKSAADLGYRAFDSAAIYGNERGVGEGMRGCGLAREEIFLTSKVWNDQQGYDQTLRAFDESMGKLGAGYLDLYLVHWPVPLRDLYVDTWRALVRLQQEGRIRSIGVSNFLEPHLLRIIGETGVAPVINQIELHPRWQQAALRGVHAKHGIVTQAWSPLGHGEALTNPDIIALSQKLGCSAAQIILGCMIHQDIVVIPKASSHSHLLDNIASLALEIDAETLAIFAGLDDSAGRYGPDPMVFETIPQAG